LINAPNQTRRRLIKLIGTAALYGLSGIRPGGAAWASTMDSTPDGGITLFLCGDVMTGRGIDQILPHPGDPHLFEAYVSDARKYVDMAERATGPIKKPVDFAYIWGDALAELARVKPHARIINLETAVTTSGAAWNKSVNYRMAPGNVPCLTAAAIDCCVLANNHVLDWGYDGLSETLAVLDKAGLKHAGAGDNDRRARAPAVIGLPGGRRVLVFAFGTESSGIDPDWAATDEQVGVNLLPELSDETVDAVADNIGKHKQPGDIVIASIHWGGNWGYDIPQEQRAFAHGLIDRAGVHVVHGHSAHHVKGMEVYKGQPIIYGCGDFIDDYEGIGGHEQYRGDLGLMYFPTLDPATGRLTTFKMTPTQIRHFRVNRASRDDAHWLADTLNREGTALGTRASLGEDDRLDLHWD
jgi:poly-gamma-glutamate capsule biosynthesis protein CapA/YwtB (metallophosphatase superfamily)